MPHERAQQARVVEDGVESIVAEPLLRLVGRLLTGLREQVPPPVLGPDSAPDVYYPVARRPSARLLLRIRSSRNLRDPVLYLCIPSYNEAPTVGVLLWRIRKVFQEYSREYEIIVYDDASTDGTRETLEPYRKVMPLTVIGSREHVGYSRAVEALLRTASDRTKYPRRDAVVLMQADFTDQPEHLPELVKRFEGGADVVAVERVMSESAPEPVRKLARLARWLPRLWPIRSFVTVPGVKDPFGGFRLLRISIVRDLLKEQGDRPFAATPVWATNVELLRTAVRLARRTESVPLESRWDLRPRESRVRPWPDVIDLVRRGWAARSGPSPRAVA